MARSEQRITVRASELRAGDLIVSTRVVASAQEHVFQIVRTTDGDE